MKSINSPNEFKTLINESSLVLVDFTATWCGPCKRIKPTIKALQSEYTNVVFCEIDVDENQDICQIYNISSMPTFLFFKNGKPVDNLTVTGANEQSIRKSLSQLK